MKLIFSKKLVDEAKEKWLSIVPSILDIARKRNGTGIKKVFRSYDKEEAKSSIGSIFLHY